jgi:hypothetical protein
MLHNNSIFYTWNVSEFEFKKKNNAWFWLVGLVVLALVALAIFLENYLLGFLLILGVILIMSQANKQPINIKIEISEEGIRIDSAMHKYEDIHAFWLKEKENDEVILILHTSEAMTPIESFHVPPEIDPLELRELLLNYIEEEEIRESYTKRFINIIGY